MQVSLSLDIKQYKQDLPSRLETEAIELVDVGKTSDALFNYTILFDKSEKMVVLLNRAKNTVALLFTLKQLFTQTEMSDIQSNNIYDRCCEMYQQATTDMSEDLWSAIAQAVKDGIILDEDWYLE